MIAPVVVGNGPAILRAAESNRYPREWRAFIGNNLTFDSRRRGGWSDNGANIGAGELGSIAVGISGGCDQPISGLYSENRCIGDDQRRGAGHSSVVIDGGVVRVADKGLALQASIGFEKFDVEAIRAVV